MYHLDSQSCKGGAYGSCTCRLHDSYVYTDRYTSARFRIRRKRRGLPGAWQRSTTRRVASYARRKQVTRDRCFWPADDIGRARSTRRSGSPVLQRRGLPAHVGRRQSSVDQVRPARQSSRRRCRSRACRPSCIDCLARMLQAIGPRFPRRRRLSLTSERRRISSATFSI